jgi:NAD-dependent DNA ligase
VDIQVKAGVDGAMAPDQAVRVLEHFTSTLDVKYVARGTLEKLVAAGVTDVVGLLRLDEAKLKGIDGIGPKNAVKIAESLKLLRESNVPCARWMAASNLFGRGFGEKRLAAIVAKYPEVALGNDLSANVIKGISEIEGVGPKTAKQFVEALPAFQKAWKGWSVKCGEVVAVGAVAAAAPVVQRFAGQVIVFTGVRNKEWEAAIVAAGGEVSTTVGKKTTLVVAKDPEENSGKIKKAREMGIRIVGMGEFEV